jgi:hypothetical protein
VLFTAQWWCRMARHSHRRPAFMLAKCGVRPHHFAVFVILSRHATFTHGCDRNPLHLTRMRLRTKCG